MKVLITEDDLYLLGAWHRTLERLGHETTLCASPVEALPLFDQGYRPDLIISDLDMPGMSGSDFCVVVKARFPELPFVLTSGSSKIFIHGQRCKADQMFMKPISRDDLLTVLSLYAPEPT